MHEDSSNPEDSTHPSQHTNLSDKCFTENMLKMFNELKENHVASARKQEARKDKAD